MRQEGFNVLISALGLHPMRVQERMWMRRRQTLLISTTPRVQNLKGMLRHCFHSDTSALEMAEI